MTVRSRGEVAVRRPVYAVTRSEEIFPCLHAILSYLDLPTRPPPLSPARAPPQGIFGFDQADGFDPADPEPIPEFEFDQSRPD